MIDFLAAAIRIATPLIFAALGGILSERAGVFAVGLEGMMLTGAFAGVIGTWLTGFSAAGMIFAAVGGGLMATLVASVTVRYRADNMVTGLTCNILALGLTTYMMRILSGRAVRLPSISNHWLLGPSPFCRRYPLSGRCCLSSRL